MSKNEFSSLSSHKKFFAENGQRIIAHYKIGIYFGNFDGGEIVFKDQNFIYKPKPNDCIIFKIHKDYYSSLKTFLVYLNRMPNEIQLNNTIIISSSIPIDMDIAKVLRNL